MSKLDVRLWFQRETGNCLDTINYMAMDGDSDYVAWLEDKLDVVLKGTETLKKMNKDATEDLRRGGIIP